MELVDKYKYIALAVLVIVTALVYSVTDMVVKVAAVMHPSTKLVVVNRVVEKRNVVVREREVVRPDGTRERESVSEDRTTTDTANSNSHESTPVIPANKRGVTLWTGGGLNLNREYHASVGASWGPVLVAVDNPVWPARLEPRATIAWGWQF